MDIVGLQGARVRLVPPERPLHLDNALRWLNDPEVTRTIHRAAGISRREEEAFFDKAETGREPSMNWAVLDEDGRHIGMTNLEIAWPMRLASGGAVPRGSIRLGQGVCNRHGTDPHPVRLRRTGPAPDRRAHLPPRHEACLREMRLPPRGDLAPEDLARRPVA